MSVSQGQVRAIIRKAVKRVAEGEAISHLNIMPMMDMMTILLVAFIFQVSIGAEALTVGNVKLPTSTSQEDLPEASVVVIVTRDAIAVEGKPIAAVKNGNVDSDAKKGGASGLEITKLTRFLGVLRRSNETQLRQLGRQPPALPELMVIADQATPYRLLLSVMFSAKTGEAGFRRFRLITLKNEPGPA